MFTKGLLTAAAACSLLASTVNAHMVITSPVPYGQDSLTNSPLENDGSDFPCKQRSGVYDISSMNNIPVGVPQKLSFKGGATHGGGSCQVSVTLDKEPTKDSEWKVIHSILGGCPNSADGNANGAPTYNQNPSFEFSMPKGMPNGQYSLAWTWFNKIGNREMYMNCAPITVTGGADNNDVFNSLPDMFVINIPNEQCGTTEGEDFVFPSPGLYVETAQKTALGSKTTGSGCASVTIKGAGAGKAGSAAQATGSSGGSSAAASSSADAPDPTSAAAVQSSAATSSQAASAGVAPLGTGNVATVTTMATVTGSSAAQGTGSSSNSGSGSCTGGGVSCSNDGSIICIGSNQWGTCNSGCAVPMALAAGTTCSGGTIAKRDGTIIMRSPEHNCTDSKNKDDLEKRANVPVHLAQHVHRRRSF
ncbi:Hypothetical predicted protein [Lecanosticta acicola]|uniref:Lytic polysaccharide monooxygenase n=1 Tax=Lecanosticta acicola TaxID=111012 RepID=A0AAI8Z620_9PEZI|nr:Hypothetical predicted protein [Lecanosticta acicola]